jgi:two-component system, OmpR family, phosphate regulon response regulator PhoB
MNELRPAASRQTINDRPPRVLVVEDDTALATMVVYNLQSEGFIAEYLDRGDDAELRLSQGCSTLCA